MLANLLAQMPKTKPKPAVLKGWKDIARFLGQPSSTAQCKCQAVRESLLRHHLAYETRRFRLLPALGLAGACRTVPFHSASLHI